ncbi:MAG: hypothetical protein Greene041679_417, partial [Parcubacteria group bacterium Greene0416_79]
AHGEVRATLDPTTPTTTTVDTTNALVLRLMIETAHEKFLVREVIVHSQVLKDGIWKPLAEYLAELVVGNIRVETGAFPYPNFEQATAGRLTFFLLEAVGTDLPFEIRVDTTGFPVGAKVRFTLIAVNGIGLDSGANYGADVSEVVNEVSIQEKPQSPRITSFTASNGVIELRATVVPDRPYRLEWSPDLKSWHTDFSFVSNNPTGEWAASMNWQDGTLPGSRRFYRLVGE